MKINKVEKLIFYFNNLKNKEESFRKRPFHIACLEGSCIVDKGIKFYESFSEKKIVRGSVYNFLKDGIIETKNIFKIMKKRGIHLFFMRYFLLFLIFLFLVIFCKTSKKKK